MYSATPAFVLKENCPMGVGPTFSTYTTERIVLVGNGSSLINRGIGTQIDSFDIVVRFNNFVTKDFEDHVGTKTNWWCRNQLDEEVPRSEPLERIILRLGGTNFEEYRKGCTEVYPSLQEKYRGVPVEIIPWSVYTELSKTYGEKFNALTGTVAIAHLIRKFPVIHVCGFDNMAGGNSESIHYFSSENTVTVEETVKWHEVDKDAHFINDLIQKNKVVLI